MLTALDNHPIDQVLVSSTSQSAYDIRVRLTNLSQHFFVLDSQTPLPIRNSYDTPATLGTDRIAAGVGAMALFPGRDCLVLDLGTCLTADFISREGVFKGGLITPGVQMRLRAMHEQTTRLPLVDLPSDWSGLAWPSLTATSTRQAILSGVLNGLLLEMNGIIDAYRQEWPDTVVLTCGGDMPTFESRLKPPIFAVPNLVLTGLNRILRYNVQNLQANTPNVNA